MGKGRTRIAVLCLLALTLAGCATSVHARGSIPGASYQEDQRVTAPVVQTAPTVPTSSPSSTPPPPTTAERCRRLRVQLRRDGEIGRYGDHGPHIGVIGDSYTEGDGQRNRSKRWVVELSRLRPAQVTADGVGYTGFVDPGPCGHQSYNTRIHKLPADDTTILLQGGLNDLRATRKSLIASAVRLARSFHHKRVVIIGPVDAPRPSGEAAVDSALREAARRAHVEYLSMLHLDPGFLPEGVHMNAAGHRAFARRVAAFLVK